MDISETEKWDALNQLLNRYPLYDSDLAQNFRDLMALFKGEETYRRIENGCMMPLVVERVSPTEISMAHHGTLNGDLMDDPMVVFNISTVSDLVLAEPFYFLNSNLGIEHFTCVRPHWIEDDLPYKFFLHRSLCSFCRTWFDTLKDQGYFDVR